MISATYLPALRPAASARARRHATRSFSWRTTFDQLLKLYEELLTMREA
jgi:glycosyltransferase involved in cell wall biosynthesis